MKANFYFHPEPLHLNRNIGSNLQQICSQNVRAIVKDIAYILQDKTEENTIIISSDLYSAQINGIDIYSYFRTLLDREDFNLFLNVINQVKADDFDLTEIAEKTYFHKDETECTVIMEIGPRLAAERPRESYINMNFDKYTIVYDRQGWLHARRQILGNHPGSAKDFMQKCKAYFPDITFSDNCETAIENYLTIFPRKIVKCLSCFNDYFVSFAVNHKHPGAIAEVVADFSGQYGLDQTASPQSAPEKKQDYTFEYNIDQNHPSYSRLKEDGKIDSTTDQVSFRSSSHFKITEYNDINPSLNKKGTKKCYGRIYFTYNDYGLFVGSIGPHI